jgi:hypothetical protein
MQAQAPLLHLTSRRMVGSVRQDQRAAAKVNRKKLETLNLLKPLCYRNSASIANIIISVYKVGAYMYLAGHFYLLATV